MKETQAIINEIKDQAHLAVTLDWGSEEQLQADTNVYTLSADHFGIDWEDHSYLLKATTPEAMDYVLKVIDSHLRCARIDNIIIGL